MRYSSGGSPSDIAFVGISSMIENRGGARSEDLLKYFGAVQNVTLSIS